MSTPVEQIKAKLPIEDVISTYMKLDRSGKNLKGKCPFHNEKTPSFYVSTDRGTYYCFGCGAKGDIFSFVEHFEGLDFMGALKLLAQRAGVELAFEARESRTEKDRLLSIMEDAAQFFVRNFATSKEAQQYVESRGITDTTAKEFRIGYVPNEWRLLHEHLKGKKYSDVDMEKVGLIKATEKGFYDRFRGRVMFPISDSSGRVIAFTGRILVDDGKSAKYLNSPDTPLFDKSSVLFGIDKAKHDIRVKNYSILVEGQMDLVLSHQAGIRNTVAVSGTALADTTTSRDNSVNNLGIVRRLSPNIILAFDSDGAGRKAALRSAEIALSLGMDVKIADLPDGKDPADLVREDPETWKNVLRGALHVVEFTLMTVVRSETDPRKLAHAIKEKVLPFLAPITSHMERAHFITMIHNRTGIPEDAVRRDLREVELKIIREAGAQKPQGAHTQPQYGAQSQSSSTSAGAGDVKGEKPARADMITRKIWGLMLLEEASPSAGLVLGAHRLRDRLSALIPDVHFKALEEQFAPHVKEIMFEAEVHFLGSSSTADATPEARTLSSKLFDASIEELFHNFEDEYLRQELSRLMSELAKAERSKDTNRATELLAECQKVSGRLSALALKSRERAEAQKKGL